MRRFIFIFLVVLSFFCSYKARADGLKYFDFYFKDPILGADDCVGVKIKYKLPEGVSDKRFKIRPYLDNGSVGLYDNGGWVDGNNLWTKLPTINSDFKVRFSGNFYKTNLWFEILDFKTGKKYKTSKYSILSRNWYKKYIVSLNQNILTKYTKESQGAKMIR